MHLICFVENKRILKKVYKLKLLILFKFRTVPCDAQQKDNDKLSRKYAMDEENTLTAA